MNLEQMASRCPDARVLGNVRLEGYRLAFRMSGGHRGVATVLPKEGCHVDGVLWEISSKDEKHLDFYEGFPHLYSKEPVKVTDRGGNTFTVMAYTMNSPYRDMPAIPSNTYFSGIFYGYMQNGIPPAPLREALRQTSREAFRIKAKKKDKQHEGR